MSRFSRAKLECLSSEVYLSFVEVPGDVVLPEPVDAKREIHDVVRNKSRDVDVLLPDLTRDGRSSDYGDLTSVCRLTLLFCLVDVMIADETQWY